MTLALLIVVKPDIKRCFGDRIAYGPVPQASLKL